MRLLLSVSLFILMSLKSWATVSLSYSGRLVNTNGSPVSGEVVLKFDLAYSHQTGVILCSQTLNGVDLNQGVFHVSLNFPTCDLPALLANAPSGETVSIRVVDLTGGGEKKYSFQAIHSVPYSFASQISKQLASMGAAPGQVLTWDGSKWGPANTINAVGSIVTSSGLVSSSASGVVTIGLINGGASGDVLQWNGSSWEAGSPGVTAEVDPKVRNFARKDALIIPECDPDHKLEYVVTPEQFICSPIVLDSQVEDTINDGVTDLAPSQNAVADALALKQGKLDQNSDLTLRTLKIMADGTNGVELRSHPNSGNLYFVLPESWGTGGQYLKTNGDGTLVWDSPSIASSSISDTHVSSISISKITGLDTALAGLGSSLGSLTTDNVAEGSNLYFTYEKVLDTQLMNLDTDPGAISDGDSVLSSIGKLSGNIEEVKAGYLKINGTSKMSGALDLDTNKIVNLADPIDDKDAATKEYVDNEITAVAHWEKDGTALSYLDGSVHVGSKIRLKSTTTNFLELQAPDGMSADKLYIFPASDTGKANQVLTTNGAGILSWSEVATSSTSMGGDLSGTIASAQIKSGAVTYDKMTITDGELPLAKVNGLQSALDDKEPKITGDLLTKYWTGTKTWRDFDTDVRLARLTNYSLMPGAVQETDTLLEALGKLESGIITLGASGQWGKTGTDFYHLNNVGIGVTTPLSPLHVNGAIRAQEICDLTGSNCKNISSGWGNVSAASMIANWPDAIVCDAGANKSIMYHDTRDSAGNLVYYGKASGSHWIRFNATTGAFYDSTAFAGYGICTGKSISTLIAEGRTYGLLGGGVDWTSTNGTDIYRSGGKVGIGTASPAHTLHVLGQNSNSVTVRIEGGDGSGTVNTDGIIDLTGRGSNGRYNNTEIRSLGDATKGGILTFSTDNASLNLVERMRIDDSGNVGIGSNSPIAKLHVKQSTDVVNGGLTVSNTAGTGNANIYVDTTNKTHIGGQGASPDAIVIVNSSGHVGIGTPTPAKALDIQGEIAKHSRSYPWHWSTESTASITATTPTWTDIPGASITYTLPANADVKISFDGSIVANTANNHCSIAIIMDSVNTGDSTYGNLIVMGTSGEHWNSFTRSKWFKNQAAGTHTVKLQLKSVNSGDCTVSDLEYSRVHMEVMGYSPN